MKTGGYSLSSLSHSFSEEILVNSAAHLFFFLDSAHVAFHLETISGSYEKPEERNIDGLQRFTICRPALPKGSEGTN